MLPSLYSGLIAGWALQEASGARASHNLLNDLTDTNTVTQSPSPFGYAAQFTAANAEYLGRADNADLSTGDIDFNLCAWVYLDTKATTMPIVMKGDATGTREYTLTYALASDRFAMQLFDTSGTSVGNALANNLGVPATATWYFLRGWHDSINDLAGIQANALDVETVATTGAPVDEASEFRIGRNQATTYMNGRIAMVLLHKRLLTIQEHLYLYNNGRGRLLPLNGGPFDLKTYSRKRRNRLEGVIQ